MPKSNLPIQSASERAPIKADVSAIKKVRTIADTLISLRPGDSLAFKVVNSPRQLGGSAERWGKNGPPTVLQVEVYPNLQPALLVLQTILESKFEILGDDAIGRSYLVEAGAEVPGKRYRHFDVSEIEYE